MAKTVYVFNTTSGNPCDVCDNMEGEHDVPPYVPVHPKCECEVSPEEEEEGDISFFVVRNIEIETTEYTESRRVADFNASPESEEISIEVELTLIRGELDDPLTVDELDIDEPSGTVSDSLEIPAHTSGSIEVEVEITEYLIRAELWQISTVTTEDVALVEEEHVEDIGGMLVYVSDLVGATVHESGIDDGTEGGGFEDDDEVPV